MPGRKVKKPQSNLYKTVSISITFDTDVFDIIESTKEFREMFSSNENRRRFHVTVNEREVDASQYESIF